MLSLSRNPRSLPASGSWPQAQQNGRHLGIGHRQTRRHLALLKGGYRRTAQTVGHKQDPHKVERARRPFDSLKKR
jgi:hypothetical protein